MIEVIHGDCLEVMRGMPAASVDSVVTDPPYHLVSGNAVYDLATTSAGNPRVRRAPKGGFMGKQWDGGDIAFRVELWAEAFRVLKPGGHLVSFGGTRTYHRMACAIEDAGFEIRDQLSWIYGSGFPKSQNVGKEFDKAAGAQGEYGDAKTPAHQRYIDKGELRGGRGHDGWQRPWMDDPDAVANAGRRYLPATDLAKQWDGWGTALKPAHEPICLARKPLVGTVAANVAAHGTGAINVDGCRVDSGADYHDLQVTQGRDDNNVYDKRPGRVGMRPEPTTFKPAAGRWPANVCHDGSPEVLAAFARFGERPSGGAVAGGSDYALAGYGHGIGDKRVAYAPKCDTGTAARFFFSAKAGREERNIGHIGDERSNHPTVKPLALMQWLCRLVTPPGGTVLDPFAGSGSTLIAADREQFHAIGIELQAEYVEIARRRIQGDAPLLCGLGA